ncbi:IS110 family transposase [Streptosporangium sp. NBC_01756]|nr:IS110 family transposase [Streptosporangium sp. NBC_01756]WSC90780.1 IS110 family transposase [Streptosporangium sp. NBC_01756]
MFVGDDWSEEHHDVEIQDPTGRRLAKAKLGEGVAGVARLHEMIAAHLHEDAEVGQVEIGIETDRGPWVQALLAAGYRVFAINPLQVAQYRKRHSVSGGKSDAADAHTLADMVRTDSHQLRPIAGDSEEAAAIKVVARAHKTLIWERTRTILRLRHALREYFPGALIAYPKLAEPDVLELLGAAPDPRSAAKLSTAKIRAALGRARRRDIEAKAEAIKTALRAEQLAQPPKVAAAYAAAVRAHVAMLTALNEQIMVMEEQVEAHFLQHPDAEIYRSQPGLACVLGARVLGEFGDDADRYASAKARRNYAGTSPITRQSGKKKLVIARYVRNDRLIDPLIGQAFASLRTSPGARAYYDKQRARGLGHYAALRQVSNRLVGILHGCLRTGRPYDEAIAWSDQQAARLAAEHKNKSKRAA